MRKAPVKSDAKGKAPGLTTTHHHVTVVARLVAMDWTISLKAPGVATEHARSQRHPPSFLVETGKQAYN